MVGEKSGAGKHARSAERGARHAESGRGLAHDATAGKRDRAPDEGPLGEADRTAHHDHLGVEHRRERREPKGQCPYSLVGEATRLGIAEARGSEDVRGGARCRTAVRCRCARPGEPGATGEPAAARERFDAPAVAARAARALLIRHEVPDLTREVVCARDERATEHEARSDPAADGEVDDRVGACSGPEHRLSERAGPGIIVDRNGCAARTGSSEPCSQASMRGRTARRYQTAPRLGRSAVGRSRYPARSSASSRWRARLPTIALLPDTDASRVLRCDLAYHAGAPAREAAAREAASRQRAVDAILPAFLLPDRQDGTRPGSRWTNLADLALAYGPEWGGERPATVGYVRDLAIPGVLGPEPPGRVLPRGSRLRLLEPYYEMWGYGYLAGVFYDLAVETGAMAGCTVTVGDYARMSWANGVSRRTLAAALIVPADSPDASGPGVALRRYERAVAVLRDAGVPVSRPDGLPVELLDCARPVLIAMS